MEAFALKKAVEAVRDTVPLVHAITNYVTVNDCANALLACGASPIMSDEPQDVLDITTVCGALVINIGTLHAASIEAMFLAGQRAADLGHPIVLDPVGAGASTLRTQTATELLDKLPIAIIRGNMSEIKALASDAWRTRGVDVCPDDAVTPENLIASATFARAFAIKTRAIVAITGALDIVTDGNSVFVISNGSAVMGRITGAGCMLSCLCAAYAFAHPASVFAATVAAVASMGLAGQQAEERMG